MSVFDIVVVAVILATGLIALSLGFVRVVLALAGWVGAAFATLYGFPYVRPIARQWIETGFIADAAAGAAIFIVTLIVLTMISHAIGRRVRDSGLNALDRSIGLVFGLFLGVVAMSMVYLGLAWAIDLPNDQPDWYRNARTRPAVEWSANTLLKLVPPDWRGPITPQKTGGGTDAGDSERALRKLMEPRAESPAGQPRPGYEDSERRDMDRLIRSHQYGRQCRTAARWRIPTPSTTTRCTRNAACSACSAIPTRLR